MTGPREQSPRPSGTTADRPGNIIGHDDGDTLPARVTCKAIGRTPNVPSDRAN